MSGARAIRLLILSVVTIVLVGLAGWFVFGPKSSAQMLQEGEAFYQAGLAALHEGNGATARLRFQDAHVTATNALQRGEEEKARAVKNARPEQLQELSIISGKALYLKALSMRDEVFARALADGKEIPETLDTSTGNKFRSFQVIADPTARADAITSLRKAALQLPREKDVQIEAIRYEVAIQPITWSLVRRFCQELLKQVPDDTRSLYLLARYEFEQPDIRPGQATGPAKALDKRGRTQVNEALAYLKKLKDVKDYPLGRTLFLEAQIRQWLVNDDQNRGEEAKAEKERAAFEALLFDEPNGALARFKRGDGLATLSVWDTDGIVGLHLLALDVAAEQQRKKGDALAKVKTALADTVAVAQKMEKAGLPFYALENLNSTLVRTLVRSQSVLAKEGDKQWLDTLELARKSLQQSLDKKTATSLTVAEFSGVLQRETFVAAKAGDPVRAAALRVEARKWVDDALAQFAKKNTPNAALELHILAAEMNYAADGKRDAVEPHLKALRDSKNPHLQAFVHLIQGGILEREGRLEKAKQELEQVLTLNHPGLRRSANIALTNIYLALGLSEKALESLQAVEKVYEAYDELTPQEKDWAQHFLRSPEEMGVLIVIANLEVAKQNIASFLRRQPGKAVPTGLFSIHEKLARTALAKLAKNKRHALLARETFIKYYAATGRLDRAEEELAAASAEYPSSVSLLQLDADLAIRKARAASGGKLSKEAEAELKSTIDQRIQKFIEQHPEDRGARLYWVSWLSSTGRSEEAIAYLKSPSNFPGVKDTTYQRMLATILFSKGDKEASKALRQLPHDPLIDAMLIQIGDTGAAKAKSVQEAMSRYVRNGLFRIWNAEIALHEKRYLDAAKQFFHTLDFTQVKTFAQIGLERALMALANEKPAEARTVITDMLKDYPTEPTLLLPYAVACLALDDVGTLDDDWGTTKNMASALHAWENAMQKTNPDRAATTLAKAELWTRSNYPETARDEVLRALRNNPGDPAALALIIRLDVLLSHVPEARKYLAQLKSIKPDAPATVLLEAQVDNADRKSAAAIKLLETRLDKHPKESAAYSFLISLLTRDKQPAQAMKWTQTWVAQMPDDLDGALTQVIQLCLAKKADAAKQKAAEFMRHTLENTRKQLSERRYADEKDPEKKRTEVLNETRLQLELRFAQAFVRGTDHAEGQRRLHAILQEHPSTATTAAVYSILGEIQLVRQAWNESVAAYSKVLELEKTNFAAGNNVAWILATQLNQPEKALEVLRTINKGKFSGKTLPGDRLNPEVLDTLGIVYHKLNRPENYQEMNHIFEAACRRYPRDARMFLYHGYAYAGLAENKKAADMFQSAIALAGAKDSTLSEADRNNVIREAEAARKKLSKN